jgi:quinol monooxygenase YgiN
MISLRAAGLFAVFIGVVLVSSRAAAQEQENPILAHVKASVPDAAKPFTLVIRLQVKEGAGDKLEAAFAKAAKLTRQEKGNRAYQLNRDPKMPDHFLVYECWKDRAALEAHLKSKYITDLLAEVHELVAAPPDASVLVPVAE